MHFVSDIFALGQGEQWLNQFWILVWQQLVTPWHFISIYGLALDLGHGLALDFILDHIELVNC